MTPPVQCTLGQHQAVEAVPNGGEQSQPKPRESRRMALLRRAGLFGTDTKGAVIRRAVSAEELAAAYHLVHDAFVERGYIQPQPSGLRLRVTEALPETATFIAVAGSQVVGVQGLAVDSEEFGLPSDGAFQGEIDSLRIGGRRVCEATNQAIAPDFRSTAVPTELMRCMFAHALAIGCDELITTVSPGHARFFELLGFKQISPIRSYSKELDDPVVVMSVNIYDLVERAQRAQEDQDDGAVFVRSRCLEDNPYWRQVGDWATEAAKTFVDAAALHRLFVAQGDLLTNCSPKELAGICKHWGPEVFNLVWGAQHMLMAG
jgi:ribosomal protein S18 acetylase RimI-like enzyme